MPIPEKIQTAASDSMKMSWAAESRIVTVSYAPDTTLNAAHATLLIDALTRWIGANRETFAVLANAAGVRGADAAYRKTSTKFFKQHRDELLIALFNIGPLIRVMAEMFRVGSGLQVKAFASEAQAREWLRERGMAA